MAYTELLKVQRGEANEHFAEETDHELSFDVQL